MKIFVSHSTKDEWLVNEFVELLNIFGVSNDEIFCTSMNSLTPGENFVTSIKNNLKDAGLVVFLISPNYIDSYYCIMEMGASWAYKENILPIIVPPLSFNWLQLTPLSQIQSILMNKKEDLLEKLYFKKLVEGNIINRLSISAEKKLESHIIDFIKNLNIQTFEQTIDLSNYELQPIVQNANPKSLKIEYKDNIYTFHCDFSTNSFYPIRSHFLSGVFIFNPYKNIKNISKKIYLTFECCSKDSSIFNITVELKSGNTLFKFFEQKFEVEKEYKAISIDIDTNLYNYHLSQLAEICFVIRPNYLKENSGIINIKNLKLSPI